MENKKEKGCVYFFKHVGLSPIKIGFSTNESPLARFEQFKTYAPYGAELIGFIRTHNAKELETELHLKFANVRLKGEWFDLSIEEVNKWVAFYSSLEDIEEENNFKVAWASKLQSKTTSSNNQSNELINKNISFVKIQNIERSVLNQAEIAKKLDVDKSDIARYCKENSINSKIYRIKDKIKHGYEVWLF